MMLVPVLMPDSPFPLYPHVWMIGSFHLKNVLKFEILGEFLLVSGSDIDVQHQVILFILGLHT
jgi:hypothetical protein